MLISPIVVCWNLNIYCDLLYLVISFASRFSNKLHRIAFQSLRQFLSSYTAVCAKIIVVQKDVGKCILMESRLLSKGIAKLLWEDLLVDLFYHSKFISEQIIAYSIFKDCVVHNGVSCNLHPSVCCISHDVVNMTCSLDEDKDRANVLLQCGSDGKYLRIMEQTSIISG